MQIRTSVWLCGPGSETYICCMLQEQNAKHLALSGTLYLVYGSFDGTEDTLQRVEERVLHVAHLWELPIYQVRILLFSHLDLIGINRNVPAHVSCLRCDCCACCGPSSGMMTIEGFDPADFSDWLPECPNKGDNDRV